MYRIYCPVKFQLKKNESSKSFFSKKKAVTKRKINLTETETTDTEKRNFP